ncbi:MAG TPA: signal recognition particle protein [Bacteroidales bacterium]|jgi:signal recognition particle subunit SRP54|nr:signal recognition particle protein [Bacteroidales bacterium]HOB27650.1 signal recognition particle protein [Bacteroidales bacterium]HOK21344.1 signal recognition particle protein [Bacteroidales bacterium]HOL74052.1 signal recognition particle protein [Bacteroidales bacterium]HPZ36968.1 signal recognition particle protein [Bacteroidales bacterium]
MFDNLSDRLEQAFKKIKGQGRISEINISETLKEIRRALVDADVNYKIAKSFTENVKNKAIGQQVIKSVSPGQMMIKIVHDELVDLMGGQAVDLNLKSKPAVILLAGLQGSGKTTFAAKLARYLKNNKKRNVILVACDVYRPAAINQLKTLGEQAGVQVFAKEDEKNPVKIALDALKYAKENDINTIIVDTAGRLAIDEDMMKEIRMLYDVLKPDETLFVVDAMTGQDAVNTAKAFNDVLDYDGVVLTKLDGDTRGGAAISIKATVNKPIKFSSIGEKLDDIDVFHPDRMASRILGMGDIVSFVERAQQQVDEAKAREVEKKIKKNKFDFNDFLDQVQQIKKMGNLKNLMSMIPGMNKAIRDIDIDDDAFKQIEAIIHSMTPYEREHPESLNGSRKIRIAKGSGTTVQDVNTFLKQFEEMRKMMKKVLNADPKQLKRMEQLNKNLFS